VRALFAENKVRFARAERTTMRLIMHRTIGLTGYIGPLTLILTIVRLSLNPIV